MRSFGPKGQPVKPSRTEQFEFTFLRDDHPETHEFRARAVTDIGALAFTLGSIESHPERSMAGLFRMIAKMLDNTDGTPAKWRPAPLPAVENEDGTTAPPKFRGPDGALYLMDAAARFEEFDAGSSRRRWLYLLEQDDEVIVDATDLMALFEWLIGLAADRPTQPPA